MAQLSPGLVDYAAMRGGWQASSGPPDAVSFREPSGFTAASHAPPASSSVPAAVRARPRRGRPGLG